MLSDITIRTTCSSCEMETWHSATSGLLHTNQEGTTVECLVFVFRCPAPFCGRIDQLIPLPAPAIAILLELNGMDERLVLIEIELLEFNEPLATWTGLHLEMICENPSCAEIEAFLPSMLRVRPIELGYHSAGFVYSTCSYCEDEQTITVSSSARQALVLLGAEEEEWSKTAFSFVCQDCDAASVLDGIRFSLEHSSDKNPNKAWVDSIDSIAVFLYCSSCGAENISIVDRKENQEVVLGFLEEVPLLTELLNVVTSCNTCGPLKVDEYPHRTFPFSTLIYGDSVEGGFIVAMRCPRCSDVADTDLPAWFIPSGPVLMVLLRIAGVTVARRLDVTPFSEDEISSLQADIEDADPDDFTESE